MFRFLLLIFLNFYTVNAFSIDTKAEQAVVIDYDTNEVLFEKNSNTKIIPASMTKIMTVYVAFDRIKNTDFSICKIFKVILDSNYLLRMFAKK